MEKGKVSRAQYIAMMREALFAHPDYVPGMDIFAVPDSEAVENKDITHFSYTDSPGDIRPIISELMARFEHLDKAWGIEPTSTD